MTSRPGRWPAPLRGHAALLLLVGGLAAVSLAGCDDAEHPTGLLPLDGGTTDLGEADAAAATDLSPGTLCRPGERRCWDENKVATCLEEGEGWLVEACPTGEHCPAAGTGCVPRVCVPGTARCADEGEAVLLCTSDGQGWSAAQPCPEAESCLRGVCLPRLCEPGEVLCGRDRLLTCEADGLSWAEEPCPAGQLCFAGACVGCVTDRDCATGEGCVDGGCQPLPLAIRTPALPEGMVGEPYAAPLEAVRLAPSASNNQPWRLVLEGGPPVRVHFFLERTPGYRRLTEVDLQRIDLGIALAHFELVARELGLAGGWQPLPEARAVHPTADPTDYLLSWCEA